LQDVRRALALGDEVKQMRGAPPDTADADALGFTIRGYQQRRIGDPAGANRYWGDA